MAASVEEFVELLSSEQHVDIARLRHLSRHGVHPAVRGEVWMYLLGVLSPDKSQEMTSVRALYNTYDGLFSSYSHPRSFSPKVSELIRQEAERVWRHRVPHDFDYLRGDQRTQYDASSSQHPPEVPKAREGSIGRALPTKAKGARERGPLRPIRAMNCHSAPGDAGSGPLSTSTSSLAAEEPLSQAAIEHEELKQHFIKRIHNVLSVWIGRKSSEQREATKLRERLLQEASVSRGGEASGSGIASEETSYTGTHLSPNGTASGNSSPKSQAAKWRPSAVALSRPGDSGENEEMSTPRPPRQDPGWPVEQSASYAKALPGQLGSSGHFQEQAVDDDSGDELFDPAMGMGVEDDDDYGYPDDLASFDGPHPHARNRARTDSKRGASRSAHQTAMNGDFDAASDDPGIASSAADLQAVPVTAANGEDHVGLGVSSLDRSRGHSSSCPSQQSKSRFRSRLNSAGRPRSPHSGYTSPHRVRAGHLGSLSPRPRSHGSPSSAGSDEENDDDEEESRAIDEELLQIQERLWSPHLVQLASPFVLISGKKRVEAGIFFAFEKLMTLIETRRKAYPLSHILATFHSLLRRTLPDLRAYFDDEGLDVTPFVKGWLESLFSGQMKLNEGGCLRLWDAYFSSLPTVDTVSSSWDQDPASEATAARKSHTEAGAEDDGATGVVLPPSSSTPLSLHLYVCLAILLHCKDTLEELDRSECESFLRGLPDLDVEKILNEAANLRLSHRQAILTCGEGEGDVDVDGFGKEQGQREMERAIWREIMVEEEVVGQAHDVREGSAEDLARSS